MPNRSCILIHAWPIIQIGLRSILQSLRIDIKESLSECPDCKVLSRWRDIVLLTDVANESFVRKHLGFMQKRNVALVGLNFGSQVQFDSALFDEILNPGDSQIMLLSKLSRLNLSGNPGQMSSHLTTRETSVLKLVALGYSNHQIAAQLYISIHTVVTHRKHITAKLGIKSISGLTLYAAVNNLIEVT